MHAPVIPRPHHPVVQAQRTHRAADVQLRVADRMTAFAGSMTFVYLHAVAFLAWMTLAGRELRTDTQLAREIRTLILELDRRLPPGPRPGPAPDTRLHTIRTS